MNAKKTVLLIVFISSILSGCSAIGPDVNSSPENRNQPAVENRENENRLEAKKLLTEIAGKNDLLAVELAKLPELNKTISMKEVASLKNLVTLYEIDPLAFKSAFDKMYQEGIPQIRKFCTPLQALFWLAGKEPFSKQNNPLPDYELERFLNKAWGVQGIVLREEHVKKILNESVYMDDKKEIRSVLTRLSTDSGIFRNTSYQDDVRDRWSNFDDVTDRLNSPRLIFKYVKPNVYYPMTLRFYSGNESPYKRSPKETFQLKTGNCGMQALFVDYCLKKAGYDSVVVRYECTVGFCGPNPGSEIGVRPTPYHRTVAFKEGGAMYELDAARHYLGGPKTYSEIAGGNPFELKESWRNVIH